MSSGGSRSACGPGRKYARTRDLRQVVQCGSSTAAYSFDPPPQRQNKLDAELPDARLPGIRACTCLQTSGASDYNLCNVLRCLQDFIEVAAARTRWLNSGGGRVGALHAQRVHSQTRGFVGSSSVRRPHTHAATFSSRRRFPGGNNFWEPHGVQTPGL